MTTYSPFASSAPFLFTAVTEEPQKQHQHQHPHQEGAVPPALVAATNNFHDPLIHQRQTSHVCSPNQESSDSDLMLLAMLLTASSSSTAPRQSNIMSCAYPSVDQTMTAANAYHRLPIFEAITLLFDNNISTDDDRVVSCFSGTVATETTVRLNRHDDDDDVMNGDDDDDDDSSSSASEEQDAGPVEYELIEGYYYDEEEDDDIPNVIFIAPYEVDNNTNWDCHTKMDDDEITVDDCFSIESSSRFSFAVCAVPE